MNIIQELSKFKHVRFYDHDHSYKCLNTNKKYTSVTTVKKKFKKPFNSKFWLGKKSKELGITIAELAAQWEFKRILGTTKGTITHNYNEQLWQNKVFKQQADLSFLKGNIEEFFKDILELRKFSNNFYSDYSDKLSLVRAELVVADEDINIAGQVDGLFYMDGKYILLDYKTDKKFEMTSKYKLINGMSHLSDCEFNGYSIQTSMYKHIIEKNTNIKIDEIWIVWLNNKLNSNYKLIKLPYLKEVEQLWQN